MVDGARGEGARTLPNLSDGSRGDGAHPSEGTAPRRGWWYDPSTTFRELLMAYDIPHQLEYPDPDSLMVPGLGIWDSYTVRDVPTRTELLHRLREYWRQGSKIPCSQGIAIVLLSGGLDSTTLLRYVQWLGYSPVALSVNYGQRHRKELDAAKVVCQRLGIIQHIITLPAMPFKGSALTGDGEVPHGYYTDETMKATVVPNRNMTFLALSLAMGIGRKAKAVFYAAHEGDHSIYPDTRPAFVQAMQNVARLCDYDPPELLVPFMHLDKTAIVRIAQRLRAPLELTWSCYEGGDLHCGKCGTCVERSEAFERAGVDDPTDYASVPVSRKSAPPRESEMREAHEEPGTVD